MFRPSSAASVGLILTVKMRFRIPILVGLVLLGLATPRLLRAQEDGPSLGDVARNLRKDKAQEPAPAQKLPDAERTVIDNENFNAVMEEAAKAKPIAMDKTVFSLDPSGNTLKVSSPDVTCSLSFNARASSLLIKPVLVEDLPLDELVKIDGPGSIQDQSLQLEVFNGTDWDLREITIGLTLERKLGENAELAARTKIVPAAEGGAPATVERRSDVTLLYHLKTDAKPFSKASFHENIGITPGPEEDWRWSIVEAKGIRPPGRSAPESLSEPLFGDPIPQVPITNQEPGLSRPTPLLPDPSAMPDKLEPGPPAPLNSQKPEGDSR
jgi:hypothetical protein